MCGVASRHLPPRTAVREQSARSQVTDKLSVTLQTLNNITNFQQPFRQAVVILAGALEVKREGPGWVFLDWKRPSDGGVVGAYHVQVSANGAGQWEDVSTCFDTMAVLTSQERGVELSYRVVAVNRVGEGVPSNTVTAVL